MFGSFKAAKRRRPAVLCRQAAGEGPDHGCASNSPGGDGTGVAPHRNGQASGAREDPRRPQTALKGVGKVGIGPLPGATAKQDVRSMPRSVRARSTWSR
jgi:hypothetical protein